MFLRLFVGQLSEFDSIIYLDGDVVVVDDVSDYSPH